MPARAVASAVAATLALNAEQMERFSAAIERSVAGSPDGWKWGQSLPAGAGVSAPGRAGVRAGSGSNQALSAPAAAQGRLQAGSLPASATSPSGSGGSKEARRARQAGPYFIQDFLPVMDEVSALFEGSSWPPALRSAPRERLGANTAGRLQRLPTYQEFVDGGAASQGGASLESQTSHARGGQATPAAAGGDSFSEISRLLGRVSAVRDAYAASLAQGRVVGVAGLSPEAEGGARDDPWGDPAIEALGDLPAGGARLQGPLRGSSASSPEDTPQGISGEALPPGQPDPGDFTGSLALDARGAAAPGAVGDPDASSASGALGAPAVSAVAGSPGFTGVPGPQGLYDVQGVQNTRDARDTAAAPVEEPPTKRASPSVPAAGVSQGAPASLFDFSTPASNTPSVSGPAGAAGAPTGAGAAPPSAPSSATATSVSPRQPLPPAIFMKRASAHGFVSGADLLGKP